MKAEDDCRVERRHTLKLRHAMEQRPSQELLWELQQEKTLLQARVQELEATVQVRGAQGRSGGASRGWGGPRAGARGGFLCGWDKHFWELERSGRMLVPRAGPPRV